MPNNKTTGKRREVRGRARRGKENDKITQIFQILRRQYKINVGGGDAAGLTKILKGP